MKDRKYKKVLVSIPTDTLDRGRRHADALGLSFSAYVTFVLNLVAKFPPMMHLTDEQIADMDSDSSEIKK